jgi:hypothetical protein
VTRQGKTTGRKSSRTRLLRRPRTEKGWLITIATALALTAIKLTVGAGVIVLLWHLLR